VKPFDRVVFVLINALIEKSGEPDVERSGVAGQDVNPELVMESVAHAGKSSTTVFVETPRIGMAERTSSGSFDALSLASLVRACSR